MNKIEESKTEIEKLLFAITFSNATEAQKKNMNASARKLSYLLGHAHGVIARFNKYIKDNNIDVEDLFKE